ncbi:MAG: carboxypeptidase [Firmicutes bacterium]|nr:carboxypeptidase [Bacillota bacterium]
MKEWKPAVPRGTDCARVIRVIETESIRGAGTDEDPCRPVLQYWNFDGELLAEMDPVKKEKEQ